MCSIAGRYARQATVGNSVGDDEARVRAMLEVMAHRGPDHRAAKAFGRVVLGHGRLAIRDLSEAAHQPIVTPDGRFALVFNGEIYNHDEFRRELQADGVTFRTTSDSEVLLHALARYGEGVLARLNGDFAIAFLDTVTGRLLLARDPYGVKPLSYVKAKDAFWFASEPTALLTPIGPAARVADERSVERYFVEGVTDDGERTFFRGIRSLPGCHRLVVDRGRIVAEGPYRPYPHATPVEGDVRATIERAVALRLESDVPVGATLSGGVDSGTVVGFAGRIRGPGFPTFTAVMPGPAFDESATALVTAQAAQAGPTFVYVTPPDMEEVRAALRTEGAPIQGFSELAKLRVACAARESGVRVLVEGKGADEVFAGYPHLQAARLATLLAALRLPTFLKEASLAPLSALVEAAYFLLPRRLRTLFRHLARRRVRAFLHPGLATRNPLPPASRFSHRSRLKSALAECLTARGLPGLLRYADRTTMAAGVEGRYPYLDPSVVSVAFGLHDDELVSAGQTKVALRRAAEGVVPDLARLSRKKDYRAPDHEWLKGSLAGALREHLTDGRIEERGWFAPGAPARLHAMFLAGEDDGMALRAFMLEAWAREFLDAPGEMPRPPAPVPLAGEPARA